MTLQDDFNTLNFWINKFTGAYYSISELENVLDVGQMSVYEDLQPKYATSQRIKDALAPFKAYYDFLPANTVSGVVVIPSNSNFVNLLDVQISYQISNRTVYYQPTMLNEDERAPILNSQINPVTITSPAAEVIAPRYIKMYPTPVASNGYTGTVTYLRRPLKPVFGYTVISGRVIVYNPSTSTELEWGQNWHNVILVKALSSIGINIGEQDIQQFAETKSANNYQTVNML
jgi:hypothetical protein